jgi:hypothetical protein
MTGSRVLGGLFSQPTFEAALRVAFPQKPAECRLPAVLPAPPQKLFHCCCRTFGHEDVG